MQEFDINEIQDFKTSEHRIGNRQFSTTRKKVKFAIMLVVTLAILAIATLQWQTFLQSFSTTRAEQVKKFTRIDNVPMWKVVVIEN